MRKDLLALVIIAPISCFCAMILQFVLKYKYDQTLIPLRKLIELRAEKRKELIAAKQEVEMQKRKKEAPKKKIWDNFEHEKYGKEGA